VSSDATGRIDLHSVLMHELGHAAGLEHDDSESSVMNSQLETGTRSTDLDDIDSYFSNGSQLAVVLEA
jgi:predicted Zn-dependent protease